MPVQGADLFFCPEPGGRRCADGEPPLLPGDSLAFEFLVRVSRTFADMSRDPSLQSGWYRVDVALEEYATERYSLCGMAAGQGGIEEDPFTIAVWKYVTATPHGRVSGFLSDSRAYLPLADFLAAFVDDGIGVVTPREETPIHLTSEPVFLDFDNRQGCALCCGATT